METAKETAKFIPKDQISSVEPHASLQYYLVVLEDNKGIWYVKEFTADSKGLHGEFHEDRF